MKSLRLLSALAVLSLGTLAFAGDKKAEDCKDCKDASACCKDKADKGGCCKDKAAKKDSEKKPDAK